MVRVEMIELCVDVLRLPRRREHRQDDQKEEAAEAKSRDGPGFETHGRSPLCDDRHNVIAFPPPLATRRAEPVSSADSGY